MIEKTASNSRNAYKPLYYFESARNAFEDILDRYRDFTLLLPGYIGFSPREGSGIYDPVIHTGIKHVFYPISRDLEVDLEKFKEVLAMTSGKKLVLFVHYFGYPDVKIQELTELCRREDCIVIEDAAHGLYTDFVDHSCGQYGDFVLYSLHKMLPFKNGGMLKVNNIKLDFSPLNQDRRIPSPFMYDFKAISDIRKRNARLWNTILKKHSDVLSILKPFSSKVTPQTFPVIIKKYDRNSLYFELNEAGFGAVSLYHTMIEPIQEDNFADAVWLSKHIINMPVHQDVTEEEIRKMAKKLISIIG